MAAGLARLLAVVFRARVADVVALVARAGGARAVLVRGARVVAAAAQRLSAQAGQSGRRRRRRRYHRTHRTAHRHHLSSRGHRSRVSQDGSDVVLALGADQVTAAEVRSPAAPGHLSGQVTGGPEWPIRSLVGQLASSTAHRSGQVTTVSSAAPLPPAHLPVRSASAAAFPHRHARPPRRRKFREPL